MKRPSQNVESGYISVTFRKTLKACEGKPHDCKLFVGMYHVLAEAIEEFYSKGYQNPLLAVGFSMIFNSKVAELKSLEESLKARGMI